MKKQLSIILITALVFGLFTDIGTIIYINKAFASESSNLIKNPGFEEGSDGWTLNSGGVAVVTEEDKHSGNKSILMTNTVQYKGVYYPVTLEAGKAYKFSFYAKSPGQIQGRFTPDTHFNINNTNDQWKLYSVTDVITTTQQRNIGVQTMNAGGVVSYLDDFCLKEIDLDFPVLNGDFESDEEDWSDFPKTFSVIEDDIIKSNVLLAEGDNTARSVSQKVLVEKGAGYVLEFKAKCDVEGGSVKVYDKGEKKVLANVDLNGSNGEWKQYTVSKFNVESNTEVVLKVTSPKEGACFIDNIAFSKLSGSDVSVGAFDDIIETEYEQAVNALLAFGFIKENSERVFEPDKKITRGETAGIAAKIMGLDKSGTSAATQIFNDVPSNNTDSKSINALYKAGFMQGDGENNFYPDQIITYDQAVTLIVKMLGFEVVAQQKGGFPQGYYSVANEKGIMKGISNISDSEVSNGNMAKMLYKALDANILEQTAFGNNKSDYTVSGEETLLSYYSKIKKNIGTVNANHKTNILGGNPVGTERILVDNNIYKTGKTNISDYIGYKVTYYYFESSDSENEIVYFSNIDNYNEVVSVSANQIDAGKTSFNKMVYYLDPIKSQKSYEIKISSSPIVIYNGFVYPYSLSEFENILKMSGLSGTVKFVDNNMDGKYEVMIVSAYEYFFIGNISSDKKVLYDELDAGLSMDLSNDKNYVIYKQGKKTGFVDLKQGDVLAVAKSRVNSEAYYEITVIGQKVTGKIEEITTDILDKSIAVIKNKSYRISNAYRKKSALDDRIAYPRLSDEGTYYLGMEGDIIAAEITDTQSDYYGVLKETFLPEISRDYKYKSNIDSTLMIRMFTQKNEWTVFECTERIHIYKDGQPQFVISGEAAYNLFSNTGYSEIYEDSASGTAIGIRILKYKLNTEGKISTIEIEGNYSQSQFSRDEAVRMQAFGLYWDTARRKYYSAAGIMAVDGTAHFNLNADTVSLFLPTDFSSEKNYIFKGKTGFINTEYYNVKAYDLDDFCNAGLAVSVGSATADDVDKEDPVFFVEGISKVLNDDGEISTKVRGYESGKQVELIMDDEVTFYLFADEGSVKINGGSITLNSGDVLQYAKSNSGMVNVIRQRFTAEKAYIQNDSYMSHNAGQYDSGFKVFGGMVLNINTSNIKFKSNDETVSLALGKSNVFIYNNQSKTIKPATAGDITIDSKIFIRLQNGLVKDIIIYE